MTFQRFDADAWARATFAVLNLDGGGGFDQGFLKVDCPWCQDTKGHGWVNIQTGYMKCWRPDCVAHQGLPVVEAARRLGGFRTRTEALVWLRREFPATGPPMPAAPPPPRYDDWCQLPQGFTPLSGGGQFATRARGSLLADEARAFAQRQWGVPLTTLVQRGVGYCTRGRYAWRLVIPVILGGQLVAFQARTYRGGAAKYLTSSHGKRGEPGAECGRPAEALLFNLDAVTEGSDVILVEGPGDVLAWETGPCKEVGGVGRRAPRIVAGRGETAGQGVAQSPVDLFLHGKNREAHGAGIPGNGATASGDLRRAQAVALLGTALTDEKAALLAAKAPGRVTVALDRGAEREALAVAEKLTAWGLATAVGAWVGGKDAGSGARLDVIGGGSLRDRVAGRLGW